MEIPNIFAFVSGSEIETAKQKSEITEHCKRVLKIQKPDEIFSDFNEMVQKLKDKDSIIITDLEVLSKDHREIARRLLVIIKHHSFVYPVKKEHYEKLKTHQYNQYGKQLFDNKDYEGRMLTGLEDLCHNILTGDDK